MKARAVTRTPPRRKITKPRKPVAAEMPIAKIKIGKRKRKDMGDIAEFAAELADVGLLHPVVITPDHRLITGERRIRAFRYLKRDRIPVTIVNIDKIARGEYSENAHRKDFTLSESVAIMKAVQPLLKAEAKARQQSGLKRGKQVRAGNLPEREKGRAADLAAKHTGRGRRTLEKAAAIIAAHEAEPDNPKITRLVEAMDRDGRANGPYRRLMNMRQAAAIRAEPPPLPGNGPYRAAVIDVPWPSEPGDENPSERGYWDFATMSIEQLKKLDVPSIMHEDSVLWFCTTNFHMRYAYEILKAWGYDEDSTPTILTWDKCKPGRGQRLLGQTEHVIMAIRGNPVITLTNQTTLLRARIPVGKPLGTKPPELYDFVESLCPATRYADIFSRYRHNERWDCHGYEAPASDMIVASSLATGGVNA